jgi:hypothetical protein
MVADRIKIAVIAGSVAVFTVDLAGCGAANPGTAAISTPSSTTTAAPTLPPMKRFRIGGEGYGPVQDCRVNDAAVTCVATWDDPYQADTYTGGFTGTLSGREMTGTSTTSQTGHDADAPDCLWQTETSTPITYTFNSDGTVSNRQQSGQWRTTHSGSCSGTESGTSSAGEGGPVRWTVTE